jgi:2-methylcitrate dehydratase PrpD
MNLLEEIRTTKQIDIEQVEDIELEIGPVASTSASIREPKVGVEGKFSVWFLAALALAEGNVTEDKFTDEKVNSPELVRLRRKVRTKLDPTIGFGARFCLTMKDGTAYRGSLAKPKGDPDNPLSPEELATKYRSAARLALPEQRVNGLLERISALETVDDMNEIVVLQTV